MVQSNSEAGLKNLGDKKSPKKVVQNIYNQSLVNIYQDSSKVKPSLSSFKQLLGKPKRSAAETKIAKKNFFTSQNRD